ncbi:MAG: hypothetical protein KJ620_05615 [Candidatus Edwardsbacteria bacterium]|nr:hypothetical protein [Candidatus Edwardsbacteria bacterium]MBU1577085.1 hypothetical protein [Candidatus Edwardsbacteria bacterium]MBU2463278.1 hypothetical protein [Candidatus Edwardsbacteria bacterium]MBU2593139.1 hypothetical protein [Candidatus Edwardsbacteria bacterium]
MRNLKFYVTGIITIFLSGTLLAQIKGSVGVNGEYDSNAYNDSYGGGSVVGTARLDLTTDIDLKLAGMILGADYSGSYSAYLSYLGINQNDHFLKMILWRGLGKDGFVGLGATYGFQLNAADRSAYDTNNSKVIGEAKIYLAQPVLLKTDGALGRYQYKNLPKYNFDQSIANLSLNLFLPTRTGLAVLAGYKKYDFSPLPADSQVPVNIINLSPGCRASQGFGSNVGLSLEYLYLTNEVTTTNSYYMPDTLLNEVNEYFDYSGGRVEAKITLKLNPVGKLTLWSNYTSRSYTQLNAFSLPAADNASILTRQNLGVARLDQETIVGIDYTAPLSEGANGIDLGVGVNYINNSSNDELYNYKKLLAYAGFNYNF